MKQGDVESAPSGDSQSRTHSRSQGKDLKDDRKSEGKTTTINKHPYDKHPSIIDRAAEETKSLQH